MNENDPHAFLMFMEEYQGIIIILVSMIIGVFTGIVGSIFGFWKVKEVRLRKVERAIGHEVLLEKDTLATISVLTQGLSRMEKKLADHIEIQDKALESMRDDIKYIRNTIGNFITELATQSLTRDRDGG